MELQNLRDQINKAGFSENALSLLNNIVNGAIARGNLLPQERTKITEIIDEEIAKASTQSSIMEEIALSLDSYAHEVNQALDMADEKTKAVEENFDKQMDNLKSQAGNTTATS